jgi:hypothetical protein
VVRRLLLLLPLLLLGAVVFALRSTETVGVEDCLSLPAGKARADCLERSLLAADARSGFDAAWSRFEVEVVADPGLHDDCHLAAHRVGYRIVDSTEETVSLLKRFPEPICSWGLGHGVLEGFSRISASPGDWARVGEVCREFLASGGGPSALCGDGFGHALWDLLPEFGAAVRGCASLEEASIAEACVGGVMMQRFRPADRGGAGSGSGSDASAVLEVCADTGLGSYEWFLPGCLAGAGYVLLYDAVVDHHAAGDTVEELSVAFAGLESRCDAFAVTFPDVSRVADLCVGSLLANLPGSLVSERQLLCAGLAVPSRCGDSGN